MLIDSHAHMTMPDYDKDRADVLKNAKKNNVQKIIEIGFDMASSQKAVDFAKNRNFPYASVGVHPHNAKEMHDDWLHDLENMATSSSKVIAIGECGLDYFRDLSPREDQQRIFREQIQLAHKLELPLVIHCRDAYPDTLKILHEEKTDDLGVVMHCFAGDYDMAMECIKRGYFLGIGGTITFKNSKQRPFINKIPLDSIVLETDCPYLSPTPYRGKRNEPAYVKLVADALAKAYETDFKEIEETTTENVKELFNIDF